MYKNERGGERGRFLVMRREAEFFISTLVKIRFLLVRIRLSLNPNLSRHIYRTSLGNEEQECFHDYTQYLIKCVIKREYYLSLFGDEKFGNPSVRLLPNFP